MEVSPTGQGPAQVVAEPQRPGRLAPLAGQPPEPDAGVQRQILENQRQQLELAREAAQIGREQRARQIAELERWQTGHEHVLEHCRESLGNLEKVHAALMGELANYVAENHENLSTATSP